MFGQIVVSLDWPMQAEQTLLVVARLARVSGRTVSRTGADCESGSCPERLF